MKKLHDERMDGKFKAARKGSLIKTHLPRIEGVSLLTFTRETDLSFIRDLEPIPKSEECVLVQRTHFLKGMESPQYSGEEDEVFKDKGAKAAVSTSTSLSLDDKPVSNLLDLTSIDIALTNLNQSKY